jgi:elongation factor Ts
VIENVTKFSKVVANAAPDIGAPVKRAGYRHFGLGAGREKDQEDFAAEVAATLGS